MSPQSPVLETSALGYTQNCRWLPTSGNCLVLLFQLSLQYSAYTERPHKGLSAPSWESHVHAFVSARIEYCNSILYGIPDYHLNKVPRIQNAAARLVCKPNRYCHITPLLFNLHWLPLKFRIVFNILLITFKALKGSAPTYIASLISTKVTFTVSSQGAVVTVSFLVTLKRCLKLLWSLFHICGAKTLERSSSGHFWKHCCWL